MGTRPRERKTNQERMFLRIKQCFLFFFTSIKRGRPEKVRTSNSRPETPPSPIPLSLFSPPRCLSFFPLISPALPPPSPSPSQRRVTLGHYFHFFTPTFTLKATWLTVTLSWLTGGARGSCRSLAVYSFSHLDKKLGIENFESTFYPV